MNAPGNQKSPVQKFLIGCLLLIGIADLQNSAEAQILDKQKLLDTQTFWDNRDWDWYKEQIPFFECPDAEITTTYYYRWELLTKHLTYGSANSGYSFTEFIDRPGWSGKYGAISCPAGHQLYEARWLRTPTIVRDYARYWFRTPGAQPRNYSTWLSDAIWATHLAHPDPQFLRDLLPDMVKNYEGWEQRHYVPSTGMFWQIGHDDGMEYNINSRQTHDILRGAPGFRPSFNAYMWADALAIAHVADLAGQDATAKLYREKAGRLKELLQSKLWDPQREFFFHMFRDNEEKDGFKVQAGTLTHQSGRFAGSPHGRELIGYVPWQFNLPDSGQGYEQAWKFLMDRKYFFCEYGPSTVERNDPMFLLQKNCCWWSGQSWPYATTQTLKAMANLLQNYQQEVVTPMDYVQSLHIFAKSHRKNGQPYIAEALHPDSGSFEGHDGYNHSEHYFHSGYCDLVITGLVGLQARDDDVLEIKPLAPADWDYFALDDVQYHGHRVSILWDRDGSRYQRGAGFSLLVDGKLATQSQKLERLTAKLPPLEHPLPSAVAATETHTKRLVNFAVNNDGTYFPQVRASHTHPSTSTQKLIDGNYWYHKSPPNRWTCEGSTNETDWVILDLGIPRPLHTVKLYVLDDGVNAPIPPPAKIEVEAWDGKRWQPISQQTRNFTEPQGHRANVIHFTPLETSQLRFTFTPQGKARCGLTEIEAWGEAELPIADAPPPAGNLAYNPGNKPFPKASASHTSRWDKVERAIDGVIDYRETPNNRWTSYESKTETDWFALDFGQERKFSRVELAIYDDHGGVQAPEKYELQTWDGKAWQTIPEQHKTPEKPTGGMLNTITFKPIDTTQLRIVFTHRGTARSGLTEILVWEE